MNLFFKPWSQMTPYLIFSIIVFLQGALLFGIDTGSFGSLQALPSFMNRFGELDPGKGTYSIPTTRKSLMNSVPWLGKISGCILVEPVLERLGYKKCMMIVGVLQILSLIIEMTAKEWIQFSIGRVFAYLTVGLVENLVPSYSAEVAPAAVRGLCAGSIMILTALGNLWGSGMSRAYVGEMSDKGWLVPCGVQIIPGVLILALIPFTPESPRWLLLHNDHDLAKKNLDRLRMKSEVSSGATELEIQMLEQAIASSHNLDLGSWLDLFKRKYIRRTWIAASLFLFQEFNGNQFVLSYGATFYVQYGLGDLSFTYSTLAQVLTVLGCAFGIVFCDKYGRRPFMIGGGFGAGFLLFMAAGLGSKQPVNHAEVSTMVACLILLGFCTRISASNNAYLIGAEIGGMKMRKKTMAFATAVDVIGAFIVTFITPYLMENPGPNLGAKIGWIFGSVATLSGLFGIFCLPELTGRSLEEVDELFEAGLHAWQFKSYKTTGIGHRLTELEGGGTQLMEEDEKMISGRMAEQDVRREQQAGTVSKV